MKNILKLIGIIALVAVITFSMACGGGGDDGGGTGGGGDKNLTGTITINLSTGVTTELTATYSGKETVRFQWNKDGSNIGTSSTTNPNKYIPTEEGNYTVTVSATGYNSKTSDAVTVILPELSGTITVSPTTNVLAYTELTATYNGSETVSYQWNKDGSNVGTTSTTNPNKYTPTTKGSYTVTVSAAGYKSKTSTVVTVNAWISINSVFGNNGVYAIAFGNNTFVAAGDNKYMATSTDGVTWIRHEGSSFASAYYNAIAFGNGKFVAGSTDGEMATSTDGVTWTAVSSSTFKQFRTRINAIAFGNNMFVAGGGTDGTGNGSMATSTDGATWTTVSNSTFGKNSIYAIAYGNDKFVAVGASGKIATSTDGATWIAVTESTFGTSNNTIYAIAYGNDKFVAGGASGKMATSDDGATWIAVTDSTFGTSDNTIYAIAFSNGKFVAGGQNGKMATSTDGETWIAVNNGNLFEYVDSTGSTHRADINVIAYGNNKFVAGGMRGKMAYLSDN